MRAAPTAALATITAALALAVPHPAAAQSYTLTSLASFDGAHGAQPLAGVVRDSQGDLFGTTQFGGVANQGTAFELAAGGSTLTTLASFNGANGANPRTGLTLDAQGNLFGATFTGGANSAGTVFELAAGTRSLTTLASFNGSNGAAPVMRSSLTLDTQGNLFGTTAAGGIGLGTVFELPAGSRTLTALASFTGANGVAPQSGLALDAQGNLFGTTTSGGTGPALLGTVFELAAGSHTITTLASFNGTNGAGPVGGLILDAQGDVFGTTTSGGPSGVSGAGTVFELAAGSHTITTLASFNGPNGGAPAGGLVLDAQGNLFGTTQAGGTNSDFGTVFELPAGTRTLTTLATFNGANGAEPVGDLALDARGDLFGTTQLGGAANQGTVFELSPAAVPEPASLKLMMVALVLMGPIWLVRRARAGRRGMTARADLRISTGSRSSF